ncbi:DUF4097 family beta strand repeat protein [Halobacillus locisalis]|uniref:DUF4097 family beta strand repeat protein n=1 Tax=Halobacillus locisalis TaxID=220753 RepID=A0A838CV15_9BACI|nr:DUF4097 family beta strand repeat-containing protein [Halobacillus locisalis]MBA2175605.1 DUF4097 family beta strand repeat protein [Halobacillus locisalis]
MSEERMKILKMIEEGIISAEEGAELLKASSEFEEHRNSERRKYGILDFLDDAYEKIKNVDLDFSFGEYVEFDHTISLDQAPITDLDLLITNGSLDIKTWEEDYVKADFGVKVYQVNTKEQARQRFLEDGEFTLSGGLLRLASPSKQVKTDVSLTVPSQSYEFVKAYLANGHMELASLRSNHFHLKTANGKVALNKIKGDSCQVETGHGAISVVESDLETCKAETVHGEITLEGNYGKSEASAISGLVTVDHSGSRAYSGFYKTTTGHVQVTLPQEKRVNGVLRSHLGSIECPLENKTILKQQKEFMNKIEEFEAFPEHEDSFHIEAEAKTGSVTIKANRK